MKHFAKVSFVIPVYNEAENIPTLYGELHQVAETLGSPYEIVFVNDGSTDGSRELLAGLARDDERVRCLSLNRNFGQSAAFAVGFRAATGDVVVTMDADLQNDPADIPTMLARYGDYDMVTGWRHNRRDTLAKRVGSKIGNFVRNRLTRETIHDTGCSLKVMRAEQVKRLKMYRGLHRFLPTLMRLEGARVLEVKVNHRPRLHGVSKYTNLRRAVEGFQDLLAVRWMMKRHLPFEGEFHEHR